MTPAWHAVAGFPRWTPNADFEVSSEVSDYPGSNLKSLPLAYPWRSAGRTPAQTIVSAVFDRPRKLGLVVLGPHNLSIGSSYQIDAFYNAGKTDLMWSSGVLSSWPSVFTEDQVDWDSGRWWDRTYLPEEIAGYPWYRPTLVPVPDYAMALTVSIIDPFNPDGYVQSGMLELADALRFPVNFDLGASYGYQSRTDTQQALGGTKYRNVKPKPRLFKGTVPYMPRDDALGSFLEMQRQLDTAVPFFWWPNPSDERHMVREAYMAHFADLDMQTYAAVGFDGVPISLEEEL